MDISYAMAEKISRIRFDDLPTPVIEKTKLLILDTIGVAMAGSSAPGCKEVVDQITACGGKRESSILVYGPKVPAFLAAFVNSMMAHARDFDETHDKALTHALVSVLPTALAVAEQSKKTTGAEFITAIVLGTDVVCRLGLAFQPQEAKGRSFSGWHFSAINGFFGSAATAAKLMKFDQTRLHNTLGIVYSQVAGSRQPRADGALTKRMQPALAAKGGIFSAFLAASGITGAKNIFEGDYGFFKLYREPSVPYDANELTDEFGQRFEILNISVKPYPCARPTHAAIRPTIDLVKREDIAAKNVQQVTVSVPHKSFESVGKPFEIRTNAQVDAQFSIPYTVAVAIARRDVTLADFETEAVQNPEILKLARKVDVVIDPEAEGWTPVEIEITLKGGQSHSTKETVLRGDPENPMNKEEITNKFRKCCEFAAKPLSKDRLDKGLETVENLERIENVSDLATFFC